MSGANLQTEGHVDVPSQSVKDLQELEASGSSPSCLPSLSPARRPPSSCPNTKNCLEIHVTLTEELGAVPPPSHSWVAPLWKICCVRHSMGEGLTMDEARGAAFLLTGTSTWVGKSAYLAADPMTIQESRWAIAQAVMDHQVKVRGTGHPCVNPLAQQSFRFDCPRGSLIKNASGDGGSDCQLLPCQPWGAEIAIDVGETKGLHHLSSPHLPQIVG